MRLGFCTTISRSLPVSRMVVILLKSLSTAYKPIIMSCSLCLVYS